MKLMLVLVTLVMFITMISGASHHRERRRNRRHTTTRKRMTTTTHKAITTKATKTTTKSVTKTTSSLAPTDTTSAGGNGTVYTGDGTWFNNGLGSCGVVSTDDELVCALNAPQMNNPANPNLNPLCGEKVKITNPANGKTVTVKIVDTCPPCLSGSIDLSPAAFSHLADLSVGRMKIKWVWV